MPENVDCNFTLQNTIYDFNLLPPAGVLICLCCFSKASWTVQWKKASTWSYEAGTLWLGYKYPYILCKPNYEDHILGLLLNPEFEKELQGLNIMLHSSQIEPAKRPERQGHTRIQHILKFWHRWDSKSVVIGKTDGWNKYQY